MGHNGEFGEELRSCVPPPTLYGPQHSTTQELHTSAIRLMYGKFGEFGEKLRTSSDAVVHRVLLLAAARVGQQVGYLRLYHFEL